jgi:hypothetical protein
MSLYSTAPAVQKRYIVNNSVMAGDGTSDLTKNDYFEIEVDPPLVFPAVSPPGSPGYAKGTVTGSLCAVCVCTLGDGLTRTVIHKAERLFGDKGISYGAGPCLIFDHIPTLIGAMEHLGYTEHILDPAEENCENLKGVCWEVWHGDVGEWLLTHNKEFALRVWHRHGDGNVKEYREWPVSFEPSKAPHNPPDPN